VAGWAIPVATDIAFALGVLSLFGSRISQGLRLFLMALAIFDDMGAILIIAFYHVSDLSLWSLGLALVAIVVLFLFNKLGVRRLLPYGVVGVLLWLCVLKSGVHATVAGVVLAFLIPQNKKAHETTSPLKLMEGALQPWVAFLVMPLFAFANAGVSIAGLPVSTLVAPVTLGIVLGLVCGKQLGVLFFSWLTIRLRFATLPENTTWFELYAVAILCGIGFTMSLFLGTLAFAGNDRLYGVEVRVGVLLGSLLSGVIGALMLEIALRIKAGRERNRRDRK
jgi:NhaA family Na+:H+ antiporter